MGTKMDKLPYDEDDKAYFESLAEKILLEREQLERFDGDEMSEEEIAENTGAEMPLLDCFNNGKTINTVNG